MLRGLLVFVLLGVMSLSVSVSADDIERELNLLYQKQIAAEKLVHGDKKPQETTSVQVNVIPVQAAQEAAPQVKEATVYQFPASQVEASPLNASKADQLRKARQDMEVQTEQAIVEQLEAQRLDWERKRAEALLKTMQEQAAAQAPKVEVQPQVLVAPAPVAPAQDEKTKSELSEIKQDLKAISQEIKENKESKKSEYYFSLGAGMPEYVDNIVNLRVDGSFGVAMGFRSPTNTVFEISLYQSVYRLENIVGGGFPSTFASIGEVNQYNLSAGAKYAFFSGRIRPLVGVLASYTRRDYQDIQCFGFSCQGSAQTNAFDLGTLIGGEVMMSDTFGISVEYQYFSNISNRQDSNYQNSFAFNQGTNYIEDKDYTIFSVRARVSF